MDTDTKAVPVVDYAAVLADLKKKRADLDKGIAAIEIVLGLTPSIVVPTGIGTAAESESAPNGVISAIASDTFFGLSIPEASKKFLAMTKKPQRTKDITNALIAGGLQHRSENFENTVGSILNRNCEDPTGIFVKLKRGTWGLRSWYKQGAAGSQ